MLTLFLCQAFFTKNKKFFGQKGQIAAQMGGFKICT
jgi:hypothetical protein